MRRAMVKGMGGVSLVAGTAMVRACTVCDSATGHAVRGRIFDGHFLGMAAMLLAPFPVFAMAGVWLYRVPAGGQRAGGDGRGRAGRRSEGNGASAGGGMSAAGAAWWMGGEEMVMRDAAGVRAAVTAGVLLGIGMGGFVDGILFHQILQLHNMLSNTVPRDSLVNEQVNMFWDGLFHAFTWMMTAAGIAMMWHAARHRGTVPTGAMLAGSLLGGWGLFNVVEGTIDHEILQVHHVYQNGSHGLWDAVFLGAGAVLLLSGVMMVRTEMRRRPLVA